MYPPYLMQGTQYVSLSRLLLGGTLLHFVTSSLHHLPTYLYNSYNRFLFFSFHFIFIFNSSGHIATSLFPFPLPFLTNLIEK